MKAIIIISLFNILTKCSLAQTEFVGDTNSNASSLRLNYEIDSTFHLDKTFDFEFRLWTHASLISKRSVFILSKKDSAWEARFFVFNGNQNRMYSEIHISQIQLDNLWQRLVANQVLTLPTQDSLKSKMKIFIADTSYALGAEDTFKRVLVTDGTTYNFELYTKHKKRSYEYHCPQSYSKNYPNVEELYRAFAIIVLVRKHLNLKLLVC